ncbi:MAG: cell division protein FtsL [Pseudomonadota bacterium]
MSARLVMMFLILVVFGSAVGAVYVKHQSRKLFVELQGLQAERDRLDVEWARLQIEQSTWATHVRVENLARTRLDMALPNNQEVVIVRP